MLETLDLVMRDWRRTIRGREDLAFLSEAGSRFGHGLILDAQWMLSNMSGSKVPKHKW